MNTLVTLLRGKEAWLMERILGYARQHGYASYTSTLAEAWRISIAGLTEAVAAAFESSEFPEIELPVHTDWSKDPVSRFGLTEARLHRGRGIELDMFLGLFVYYRQAYQDCAREFLAPSEERDRIEHVLIRLFDRMGIAFCSEWAGVDAGKHNDAMASTLREMTNEKNRYLTFFEGLDQPVIFASYSGVIENLNRAAASLVTEHALHGQDYYSLKAQMSDSSLCGKNVSDIFPWLAEIQQEWLMAQGKPFEKMVVFSGPGLKKTLRASINFQPDVSGKFTGVSILLRDETERMKSRERILRAKEELERTFDTISDIVFLLDGAGIVQRANKALAVRLGLTPKEIVGRSCEEMLGCAECHFPQDDCSSKEVAVSYPNLPGSFMVRSNSLLDSSGTVIGKVFVARDVSASEKIRQTLLAVEGKYKSIFDNAPVGIFQSTPEGTYLSVNATMTGMFGFASTDEMIRHYTDISTQMYVDPEDRKRLIAEGLATGEVSVRENRLLRKDNSSFWGRMRGRVVRDTDGRERYFEGFIEDVTASRSARESLMRSEQRFRNLAENMSQGLIQTDPKGNIGYCNKHFCSIVRKHHGEVIGSDFIDYVHEEDTACCVGIFGGDSCVLPGSRYDLRMRVEGDVRFTLVTPVALKSNDGECLGFWLLIMDTTERRMLESQLLQTQKLEAIGQLAAGIAHEINTPTQYVMNNMWFIKEGMEQLEQALGAYRSLETQSDSIPDWGAMAAMEKERQIPFYLDELPAAISETLQGLDRISAIVNSVKQFAHPGHDRQQEIDLNTLIEQTVTVSRNEWKYVAETTTNLDPDLPPVVCSSQEIGQVLLNLVVNAAHAIMDAPRQDGAIGRITISTRRVDNMAEIRVQDTGTGIPPQAREHLFEPFFTTKPVGQGTGQGLFIAHRVVVKEHGGTIRFETENARGTTFIITLPLSGKAGAEHHG
jgi:PAS domain S-box-containing protein